MLQKPERNLKYRWNASQVVPGTKHVVNSSSDPTPFGQHHHFVFHREWEKRGKKKHLLCLKTTQKSVIVKALFVLHDRNLELNGTARLQLRWLQQTEGEREKKREREGERENYLVPFAFPFG